MPNKSTSAGEFKELPFNVNLVANIPDGPCTHEEPANMNKLIHPCVPRLLEFRKPTFPGVKHSAQEVGDPSHPVVSLMR
jgi:hypothetical protein